MKGRASRLSVVATVTDVNRQTVTATASVMVHPAAFYLAAKPSGDDYFWVAGKAAVDVAVVAVRPDGARVPGAGGARRHRAPRVAPRRARTRRAGRGSRRLGRRHRGALRFRVGGRAGAVPLHAGIRRLLRGRVQREGRGGTRVATSFYRWATGAGWVPWGDETQFKMDVIPDRTRYNVGDTATVLFASPFTNAEAWITVEREGVIEQRRLRIVSGSTTLKLPMTEAFVPNVDHFHRGGTRAQRQPRQHRRPRPAGLAGGLLRSSS